VTRGSTPVTGKIENEECRIENSVVALYFSILNFQFCILYRSLEKSGSTAPFPAAIATGLTRSPVR
jgi:hypothetical protein